MRQPDINKPFPVRLGELKMPLLEEAAKQDRSLTWLIRKILKLYVDGEIKKV